jgi:hypothetical protein
MHPSVAVGQKIVAPIERTAQCLVSRQRGPPSIPAQTELAFQQPCQSLYAKGADARRR